jgi:hypothetical protein
MDPDRREKLAELYFQDPRALPGKEVKPLKYSKLDRFANNMEVNLYLAANAQLKDLEAFEQTEGDLGYLHLQNASDFIRNGFALVNLERLKIRDPTSANAIKNYIYGAELISPQMKQIIDNQKKLTPKYYQNSYYIRRNSYTYGNSNYSNQMASQIANQLAKTFIALSISFFLGGVLSKPETVQPTFPRNYRGGRRGCGNRGNRKY